MNRGGRGKEEMIDFVPIESLVDAYSEVIEEKSDTLQSWISEVLFPLYYNQGVHITDPELLACLAKKASIFSETKLIDLRVSELRLKLEKPTRDLHDEIDFLKRSVTDMFSVVKNINTDCLINFSTATDEKLWLHKKNEISQINARVSFCCVALTDFMLKWLNLCQDENIQMKINN